MTMPPEVLADKVGDECPTCGAWMLNPALHHAWHDKMPRRAVTARRMFSYAERRGENNPSWSGQLYECDVREIKIALARGARQCDLAEQYGVPRPMIQRIACGRNYAWLEVDV